MSAAGSSHPVPRVLPCGDDALLLEFADGAARAAYVGGLSRTPIDGLAETVPGARTLLLRARSPRHLREVAEAAGTVVPVAAGDVEAREVSIPVRYDGADLADVADLLAMSVEAFVARHGELTWTSAFCGFSPGFAYLTSPDAGWTVPRRGSPRPKVPVGSVALAGEYTGCYPTASPGGWQLIGTTDAVLFDTALDPPALCAPGRRIRFVDVTGRAT